MTGTYLIGALFFLALLGWAFALMMLCRRISMGAALIGALSFMLLAAYTGVIVLGFMRPTAYALIFGGLGCLAFGYTALRRRELTVALPLYLAMCAAYALLTVNIVVCDHDSMSFWMRAVKELFTFDRFYIRALNPMYHTDYIPMSSALQYCVVRVFGWRDAYPLFVTFACVAASICAIAELPRKRLCGLFLGGALFYAMSVFHTNYVTPRTDIPMCALFTAGLCILFLRRAERASQLTPVILLAGALTGLKIYIGLLFALSVCLSALYRAMRERRAKSASARAYAVAAAVGLALVLFVHFSWSGIYNFSIDKASYDTAVIEGTQTGSAPVFSLSYLVKGNPRTSRLMDSLTPEALRAVGALIADTARVYVNSRLVWIWLFVAGASLLLSRRERSARADYVHMLVAMLITGAVFVLGLFGSYFVQAETFGAATTYLTDAILPLCWFSLLVAFEALSESPMRKLAPVTAALMLAGLLVLSTPGKWLYRWTSLPYYHYEEAKLATDFYYEAIPGELNEGDAGKTALLIDCSEGATYFSSMSGKTHAYQYYALPTYVTVYQYEYGSEESLSNLYYGTVVDGLKEYHANILILNVDDEAFWQRMCSLIPLPEDAPMKGVYDVTFADDGAPTFTPRAKQQ